MSEHWTVVFDGTDHRPLGRLLFPPTLPEPVRPRSVRPVAPQTPVVAPKVERTLSPRVSARGGEVKAAHDDLWKLLEFPRTTRELVDALDLPMAATTSAIGLAYRLGVLVSAGHRKNEPRTIGEKTWSRCYMRAPQYADAPTWPYRYATRAQRGTYRRRGRAA